MSNVLSLVKAIQKIAGEPPCKKTMQKMVYLLQEAHVDLGFDYSIHFYGPYSAELDSEIRYLSDCGQLNMDITEYGHMLSANDSTDIPSTDESAHNIISYFGSKTPSQLELLATTLYVQREISNTVSEDIINGVKKIKGTKYSSTQIDQAIHELEEQSYFTLQ